MITADAGPARPADTANWSRRIVLLLASQVVSIFGSSLVQFAIHWSITLRTQSGTMVMLSTVCGFLPQLILSPFSGVWADRFDRKKLIILADAGIALATLLMAIAFWLGYEQLWLFFLLMAIRSAGSAIQHPALQAMLPQLVPPDRLNRINAINGSLHAAVSLASPVLGGLLYALSRIATIFMIDVVTAMIAIVILALLIRVPRHQGAAQVRENGYLDNLSQGFTYIRKHRYLLEFFIFSGVFMFLAAPSAMLTPLQATRKFGQDVGYLTAMEISFAAGMVVGGLIMSLWNGLRNKMHTIILAIAVIGMATIIVGLVPSFIPYLAGMVIIGVALPFFNTPATVILQQQVEDHYLGRVFGVLGMFSSTIWPLAMLLFGPLTDRLSIDPLLQITGTLMVMIAFGMSRRRRLIRLGAAAPGEAIRLTDSIGLAGAPTASAGREHGAEE